MERQQPGQFFPIAYGKRGERLNVNIVKDSAAADVYDGEWHLVTATLQNSTTYSIYVDGEVRASVEAPSPIVQNPNNHDLWLGARPNTNGTVKMTGKMDRVRMWDVALTSPQILELYNSERASEVVDVVKSDKPMVLADFSLMENYPNPFNPSTTIYYSINKTQHISLAIFNVLGQHVTTLVDGIRSPGNHSVQWNGFDKLNRPVPSGMYLYKLSSDNRTVVKKMMLVK